MADVKIPTQPHSHGAGPIPGLPNKPWAWTAFGILAGTALTLLLLDTFGLLGRRREDEKDGAELTSEEREAAWEAGYSHGWDERAMHVSDGVVWELTPDEPGEGGVGGGAGPGDAGVGEAAAVRDDAGSSPNGRPRARGTRRGARLDGGPGGDRTADSEPAAGVREPGGDGVGGGVEPAPVDPAVTDGEGG